MPAKPPYRPGIDIGGIAAADECDTPDVEQVHRRAFHDPIRTSIRKHRCGVDREIK